MAILSIMQSSLAAPVGQPSAAVLGGAAAPPGFPTSESQHATGTATELSRPLPRGRRRYLRRLHCSQCGYDSVLGAAAASAACRGRLLLLSSDLVISQFACRRWPAWASPRDMRPGARSTSLRSSPGQLITGTYSVPALICPGLSLLSFQSTPRRPALRSGLAAGKIYI